MASAPSPDPLEDAERLIAEGRAAEAVAGLRALLYEGRGGLLARITYAKALLAAGEADDAIAAARETALLFGNVAAAALGVGEILLRAQQLPTAIAEFQRALRLDPGLDAARFLLGQAWLEAGEPARALDALEQLSPSTPGLAAATDRAEAMRAQPRCDAGYVRHLFDQFSADYDERMVSHLTYRAPQILRSLFDLTVPGRADLEILDLGCGTGLSGAAFKDKAARLEGIDLSPAMIEKARARGTYDALRVSDIENGIGDGKHDLVLAADTLVYLGDLRAVVAGVARTLKPYGIFLFTVEKHHGTGFALGPKRRWRHSEPYLRDITADAGLSILGLLECVPRMEANAPVDGLAMALHKAS